MKIELKNYLVSKSYKAKINSKDVQIGDVFLALKGKNRHGNEFIDEALSNGAKYIITDKIVEDNDTKNNILLVDNTLDFIEELAIYKRNLFKGQIIGITGSIGKTSVKENLKYFLSPHMKVSASIKSFNNYLGVILSLINMSLESDYAIFELGTNNFNEIKKLTNLVLPTQAIITNIYPTHLEKLINTRNIAIEKSDIFNPKFNPKVELAILSNNNIDEHYVCKKAKEYNIKNIITFGENSNSDLKIKNIKKIDEYIYKITIMYKNDICEIIVDDKEIHKIDNILICYAIFKYNNLNINNFLSLTKNIPSISGRGLRSSLIINKKKINFIDESYNASPKSMKICIDYFNSIEIKQSEKKILILGEMKELGSGALDYHIEIIKYVIEKNINNVIISGELMELALDKIDKMINHNIYLMHDIKKIIEYLEKNLNDGDTILIKGSNSSITNQLSKNILTIGEI